MLRLSRETEFIFEMKFCLCLQGDKDTIETHDHGFWLLFNAFIIQHISSWRVRSLAWTSINTNADKLHFIFKFEITIALLTNLPHHQFAFITYQIYLSCRTWLYVDGADFEFIYQLLVDAYTRFTWAHKLMHYFLFPFLLFLNQCASPVAIRDTKSAGLRSNLLSKKHCLIRFRSMTGPHRFPMTHIISTLT